MEKARKPRIFYGYIIVATCFFIMTVYWGTTFSYGIFKWSTNVDYSSGERFQKGDRQPTPNGLYHDAAANPELE